MAYCACASRRIAYCACAVEKIAYCACASRKEAFDPIDEQLVGLARVIK
jgi:hypothetical protein